MVDKLKREPVRVRSFVMSALALLAVVVPGVDMGSVEGVVSALLIMAFGETARARVTPV